MKTYEEFRKLLKLDEHGVVARPRVVCSDGYSVSIQANFVAYCFPRNNLGGYTQVELGFPSMVDDNLISFAENLDELTDLTDTVYPYVPTELIYKVLCSHGDFEIVEGGVFDIAMEEEFLNFFFNTY